MISYLGKTYNSDIRRHLTDLEYEEVVRRYYERPDFSEVRRQLRSISDGGVRMDKVTDYYFKDLMAKVRIRYNNWTIEEAMSCREIVEYFAGKTMVNEKVFPPSEPLWRNIETALRVCGFKVASKPSVFPMRDADFIVREYCRNGVMYDFSCGWGTRLLSAMKNGVEYLGTDVNFMLVDRLRELASDYAEENGGLLGTPRCDVRCVGSEEFQPDWEGVAGLAFSSPPYFSLEDYRIGRQSYRPGMSYGEWLGGYVRGTVGNVMAYLVPGGHFVVNVKDFGKFRLTDDFRSIAESLGFEFVRFHVLRNASRCHGHREWRERPEGERCGWHDSCERMMVFRKKEE